VLYNGTEPYPDEGVLKLSDAFEEAVSAGFPRDRLPALELRVNVYKIK
jgi:hypothetical protein